jgi:hypothetical protein
MPHGWVAPCITLKAFFKDWCGLGYGDATLRLYDYRSDQASSVQRERVRGTGVPCGLGTVDEPARAALEASAVGCRLPAT